MPRAARIGRTRNVNPTVAGGGEGNTASNVGSGAGLLFKQKTGVDLQMKSLKSGTRLTVTNGTSDVTLTGTGQAVAVARVSFNGNSGSILGSSGVSSVTRHSTGLYTITFSSPMANANYTVVGSTKFESNYGTIQTSKTPADSTLSMMLHGNGTNGSPTITDNGFALPTLTPTASIVISTAQKKFGTGSIYFDGASWIGVADNAALHFGAGDFCIEFWLYMTSWTANQNLYVIQDSGGSEEIQMRILNGNPFQIYMNNSAFSMTCNPGISLNTWTHVALSRYGGTIALFIDGVSKVTGSPPTITTTTKTCRIGAQVASGGAYPISGYLDEFRITKGYTPYTGNFTPAAAEFTGALGGDIRTTTICVVEVSQLNALADISIVSVAFL